MTQAQRFANYREAYGQALYLAELHSDDPALEANPILLFVRDQDSAYRWFDELQDKAGLEFLYPRPPAIQHFMMELGALNSLDMLDAMAEAYLMLVWVRVFSLARRRHSKGWAGTDWDTPRLKEYKQAAKKILKLHSFAVAYGRDPVPYLADHPSTKAALEAREQMLMFKELGESEAAF